jgi:hypothetical protein
MRPHTSPMPDASPMRPRASPVSMRPMIAPSPMRLHEGPMPMPHEIPSSCGPVPCALCSPTTHHAHAAPYSPGVPAGGPVGCRMSAAGAGAGAAGCGRGRRTGGGGAGRGGGGGSGGGGGVSACGGRGALVRFFGLPWGCRSALCRAFCCLVFLSAWRVPWAWAWVARGPKGSEGPEGAGSAAGLINDSTRASAELHALVVAGAVQQVLQRAPPSASQS